MLGERIKLICNVLKRNNLLQVFSGHLMPHSTYRDLAVCLNISQKHPFAVSDETLPENLAHVVKILVVSEILAG
jgi:hypothetical protein